MRPSGRLARLVAATALMATTPAFAVFDAPTRADAQASDIHLHLVSMPLSIEQDQPITIVVDAAGDVPTDAVVVVTAYPTITTRDAVAAVAKGQLPSVSAAHISIVASRLARDVNGAFVIPVPTQSTTNLPNRLRLKQPGLYPLSIELRDSDSGATLAQLPAFIERLGGDRIPSQVSVGWLFDIDSPPTLQPAGVTEVSDQARAQLSALSGFLQQTVVPMSVLVRPELVDGLKRNGTAADLALIAKFAGALGTNHELLAETSVSMDPSAAVAAGLQSTFTDQLRLGEDQLASALGVNTAKRTSWYIPTGTDPAGLSLLRGLGVQHVVLGQSAALPQPVATATGELGRVSLGVDQSIPALVTDPTVDAALRTPTDDPVATAHLIVADLTALGIERDQQLTTSADAPARGVVVAAGVVGSIDPTLLQDVLTLMQHSSHIALRSVDAVLSEMERGTNPADMRAIGTNEANPVDLRSAASTLSTLNSQINSYAGMLPAQSTTGSTSTPADPRPAMWRRLLEVYPADNITNAQRQAYAAQITRDFAEIRDSVTWPALGHITIGGRTSDIPFVLDNTSDVSLTVMLRLRSAKMDFGDGSSGGDQIITVAAANVSNGRTSTNIRVRARSGAEFSVQVQLFTPDGKEALGPQTSLTVRASVLTGLGQVVTGALLVVLATWWLQNFMRARRQRRLAEIESRERHPVINGTSTSSPDVGGEAAGANGSVRPEFDDDPPIAVRADKVADS